MITRYIQAVPHLDSMNEALMSDAVLYQSGFRGLLSSSCITHPGAIVCEIVIVMFFVHDKGLLGMPLALRQLPIC